MIESIDDPEPAPPPAPRGFLFLDIEASGLDERAYPIEIGWVMPDGSGDSILIRPAQRWTYWSYKSEWVHRIHREMLAGSGVAVREAARLVADLVRDRTVYVDSPGWDASWLLTLFAEGGVEPDFELRETQQALDLALAPLGRAARLGEMGRHILAEARAHADSVAPKTHRALADARNAWTKWRHAVDRVAVETERSG